MTNRIFTTTFDNAKVKAIGYNPEWENGTGYLDHAVRGHHAPALAAGEMVKTTTTKGRKVIMVGTPVGNLVVFQRYSDNPEVFVFNAPQAINRLYGDIMMSGILSKEALTLIFGDVDFPTVVPNIGSRMAGFLAAGQVITN